MKPLRYLGLALAGMLGLMVLGAILLFVLFDEAAIKRQLMTQVAERSSRELIIDGPLGLSVWPDVALAVGGVRLSEVGGKGKFASLKNARIGVAVMPLLSGKVLVRRVEIDGLTLDLVRRRDGSLNIDDVAGAGKTGAESPAELKPASPLVLDVAGMAIRDARVSWLDEATGKMTEIRDFDLSTGTVEGDTGQAAYRVRDLVLSSRGKLDKAHFELMLDAPALAFNAGQVQGDKIGLAGRFSEGDRKVDARVGLSEITGSLASLQIRQFDLALDAALGAQQLKANLASPVAMDVGARTLRLDKLVGQLSLNSPALPMKQLVLPLHGHFSVNPAKQQADIGLATQFDDSRVDLAVAVERFAPIAVGFTLAIDQLDVDRYLPPAPEASTGGEVAQTTGAAASSVQLDALKGLDVHGTIKVGRLQAHRLKLSALDARMNLKGGRLEVAPLRATLYGGTMDGALAVNANNSQFSLRQQLRAIDISPLLKDLADKDVLEGRGSVSLDLTTRGETVMALRQGLTGQAALDLRDGAIKGVNVAKLLRDAKSALSAKQAVTTSASAAEKTDFSALTASFQIDGGVARNHDLSLMSPFLRMGGEGAIDIGQARMDYLAKVSVVNTSTGQEGKELAHVRGVTLPLRIRGPWAQLGYTLEMDKLLEEVAKAKLDENKDKLKEKATEKLGQELFKLFGR